MAHQNNNPKDKPNAAEAAIPLMAAAMIQQGGGNDDALRALVNELAQTQLERARKEKEKKERLELSAIQTVKEQTAQRKQREDNCSHLRQDNTSRLAGQRLSNGQICLVCQFCGKEFHHPPQEDQVDIPRHLRPPADSIGDARG